MIPFRERDEDEETLGGLTWCSLSKLLKLVQRRNKKSNLHTIHANHSFDIKLPPVVVHYVLNSSYSVLAGTFNFEWIVVQLFKHLIEFRIFSKNVHGHQLLRIVYINESGNLFRF